MTHSVLETNISHDTCVLNPYILKLCCNNDTRARDDLPIRRINHFEKSLHFSSVFIGMSYHFLL